MIKTDPISTNKTLSSWEQSIYSSEKEYPSDVLNWFSSPHSHLISFAPILSEFKKHYSTREKLASLNYVIELGTGKRVVLAEEMFQLLKDKFSCISLPKRKLKSSYYQFEDINQYLQTFSNYSLDLVYSRFLLEENSFHPISLLFSSHFLQLLTQGKKKKVMEIFPGSSEYIRKTYQILSKKMKKQGRIIGFVVDRKKAEFIFEKQVLQHFILETALAIGPRMGLFTLQKK